MKVSEQGIEREDVRIQPKAGDITDARFCGHGMHAAPFDIRDVDFDGRESDAAQAIAEGVSRIEKAGWIDQDAVATFPLGIIDPADGLALASARSDASNSRAVAVP